MVAGVWPERTVLGPWGSFHHEKSTPFDYRPQGTIAGLTMTYGLTPGENNFIHSLTFKSRKDGGGILLSPQFGKTRHGSFTKEIVFTAGEYITGIDIILTNRKHIISSYIRRLRVYTNKKMYTQDGDDDITTPRTFIPTGGVVVGFFGSVGSSIFAIGIYTVPYDKVSHFERDNKAMSIGPFGGPNNQGQAWTVNSKDHQISEIIIRYEHVVHSIVLQGKKSDGSVTYSKRFGGPGGNRTNKISFGPGEYITGIEVMLGSFDGQTVVYNLSICTNVTNYGPFGTRSGTQLSIPIRDGRVVGFFGRSGTYLNAIGVYTVSNALRTGPFLENKGPLGGKMWDECIIIGPWGGSEGVVWTYRPTEFITKIEIQHGDCIDSLTFHMTARDGTVTQTQRFGGSNGNAIEEVIIDSKEHITGMDIMVGEYDGISVITKLRFHTNITTYGPYGTVNGSKISIPIKDGRVVGFYGRYGNFLNSIGIFAVVKNARCQPHQDKVVGLQEIGDAWRSLL